MWGIPLPEGGIGGVARRYRISGLPPNIATNSGPPPGGGGLNFGPEGAPGGNQQTFFPNPDNGDLPETPGLPFG
jgi:hypothetical protein